MRRSRERDYLDQFVQRQEEAATDTRVATPHGCWPHGQALPSDPAYDACKVCEHSLFVHPTARDSNGDRYPCSVCIVEKLYEDMKAEL